MLKNKQEYVRGDETWWFNQKLRNTGEKGNKNI